MGYIERLIENCKLALAMRDFRGREIELRVELKKQAGSQERSFIFSPLIDSQDVNEDEHNDVIKCTDAKHYFGRNSVKEKLGDIRLAIYVIEEVGENANCQITYNSLNEYREQKKRKCSKLNAPCRIMYVGSSSSSNYVFIGRLKNHMGEGPEGTYALNLKHWFTGKCKITIRQYEKYVSRDVLQILEDDLASRLEPAFGKRGGNGR